MGQSLIGQQHKIGKNTGPQLRAQESAREFFRPPVRSALRFIYENIMRSVLAGGRTLCTRPKLCPSDLKHPGR
jgi:hypothetical protein